MIVVVASVAGAKAVTNANGSAKICAPTLFNMSSYKHGCWGGLPHAYQVLNITCHFWCQRSLSRRQWLRTMLFLMCSRSVSRRQIQLTHLRFRRLAHSCVSHPVLAPVMWSNFGFKHYKRRGSQFAPQHLMLLGCRSHSRVIVDLADLLCASPLGHDSGILFVRIFSTVRVVSPSCWFAYSAQ